MTNLANLIQTKINRSNELRNEIDSMMSALFTASLLVYAVRKDILDDLKNIPIISSHMASRIDLFKVEHWLRHETPIVLSPLSEFDDNEMQFWESVQTGFKDCFKEAGNQVTVSIELSQIIGTLANELRLTAPHSQSITAEGLIVDLLQSDVSKEPWASIDHPGVFTKAQVEEEIMLRLVSNRYGSGSRSTTGVLIDRFDGVDKHTFKQKVRDLCEEPPTQSFPTTLKDFVNEKDHSADQN